MAVPGSRFLSYNFVNPGSRAAARVVKQPPGPSNDLNTLVLIGQSTDGPDVNDSSLFEDDRYVTIGQGRYQDAMSLMGQGELVEAAKLCSRPSLETPYSSGPVFMKLLNTNPNVAASAVVSSTSQSVDSDLTISATIPGPSGNKIRFQKNADKTISFAKEGAIEKSRTLEIKAFKLTYTGDSATALLVINSTGIAVTLSGAQTDGTQNLNLLFADYPTLGELAEKINAQGGYLIALSQTLSFKTEDLDHIESADGVDIVTEYTAFADLFSEETFFAQWGAATLSAGQVRKPINAMSTMRYLSGGATGTPAADAIDKAIQFARDHVSGRYRVLLSASVSKQLLFTEAVGAANTPAFGKETIGGTGCASTDLRSDRYANAMLMGTEYMIYGAYTFYQYDLKGREKLYNGYMLAAMGLAMMAATDCNRTPTWKSLNILRFGEGELSTFLGGEVDEAIQSGSWVISRINKSNATYAAIPRAVTTYRGGDSKILSEVSSVATILQMTAEARDRINTFVARTMTDESADVEGVTETDVISEFEHILDDFVSRGYLIGSKRFKKPAWYKDYTLKLDGDTFWFENVQGHVVMPINFIFMLFEFSQLSGSSGPEK